MIDLVDAIVHAPDIDPILQVALLRKVVGAAVEASEPLRESLDQSRGSSTRPPLTSTCPG